jgi:hypothetical protein
VEVVAATLGYNVNHAASGAAIFSVEAARLNLKFLHQCERNLAIRVDSGILVICNFLAIDNEYILGICRPIDGKATGDSVWASTRARPSKR